MTDKNNTPREPADRPPQGPPPSSPHSPVRTDLEQANARLRVEIAERQRAEQALRQAHEELEQRAAQLQRLAAELTQAEQRERRRLAHILYDHLQQPLVGAKFHLGVLHNQPPGPQQQRLRQVESLLDQSLAASRSLTVDLSPPILYEGTFGQVVHWLARWVRDKHKLHVQVDVDEQTEPQSEEMRVLLFEAIRELLINVVKHAGAGRASVRLTHEGTETIRVSVADSGAGFVPRRPGQPQEPGKGFGLFSIRERLTLLGGQMRIDSAPGRGTRVTLLAPGRPPAVRGDRPARTSAGAEPTILSAELVDEAAPRKIRVVLADDHDVVRNGLARLLQMQTDIEVIGQASDGQMAVEQVLALRPDVVIMDVSMPRLNGMEATRRITVEAPDICVIGLSMHGHEDVAAAMAAAGATAYLAKTAPPESLIAAIRTCGRGAGASA